MGFGTKIKSLRNEKGWSQEYVCEKTHISPGALSRYENEVFEPKSLELVKDFANLFDVSTDYLLGKSDIRNPEEIKFANAGGINTEGLSEEEIKEIQRQVEFMRWKKKDTNDEDK